jgi:hypothetical protein
MRHDNSREGSRRHRYRRFAGLDNLHLFDFLHAATKSHTDLRWARGSICYGSWRVEADLQTTPTVEWRGSIETSFFRTFTNILSERRPRLHIGKVVRFTESHRCVPFIFTYKSQTFYVGKDSTHLIATERTDATFSLKEDHLEEQGTTIYYDAEAIYQNTSFLYLGTPRKRAAAYTSDTFSVENNDLKISYNGTAVLRRLSNTSRKNATELCFKLFDSNRQNGFRVPHAAFFDSRPDAKPRESYEIRTVCYFE